MFLNHWFYKHQRMHWGDGFIVFFSKCEGEFELNYSVKTAFEICSF